MDYRDYMKQKAPPLEQQFPTFLYAMPMSPTRVFFEVFLFYINLLCYFTYQNHVKLFRRIILSGNLSGFKRCNAFWSTEEETLVTAEDNGNQTSKNLRRGKFLWPSYDAYLFHRWMIIFIFSILTLEKRYMPIYRWFSSWFSRGIHALWTNENKQQLGISFSLLFI